MIYVKVRNDISVATLTRIISAMDETHFNFEIFIDDIQKLDFRIYVPDIEEAQNIVAFVNSSTEFPRNSLKIVEESN